MYFQDVFETAGMKASITMETEVVVETPGYFANLSSVLSGFSLEYVRTHYTLIHTNSPHLASHRLPHTLLHTLPHTVSLTPHSTSPHISHLPIPPLHSHTHDCLHVIRYILMKMV